MKRRKRKSGGKKLQCIDDYSIIVVFYFRRFLWQIRLKLKILCFINHFMTV